MSFRFKKSDLSGAAIHLEAIGRHHVFLSQTHDLTDLRAASNPPPKHLQASLLETFPISAIRPSLRPIASSNTIAGHRCSARCRFLQLRPRRDRGRTRTRRARANQRETPALPHPRLHHYAIATCRLFNSTQLEFSLACACLPLNRLSSESIDACWSVSNITQT